MIKEQGIPVSWTPLLMHVLYAVRSFHRLLEECQLDIYVPFFVLPAYYAAGYARHAGIPTVGALFSDELYFSGIVDEFVNGDPDFRLSAVVPVSAFLESQASSTAAALGVVVRRISNGIPIPARTAEPPARRQRLSLAARETAPERYSIEQSARQWVDMLEHLYRRTAERTDFPAFGRCGLPPPNPKFGIYGATLPWHKEPKISSKPFRSFIEWPGQLLRFTVK